MTASKELLIFSSALFLFGLWRGWRKRGAPWHEQVAAILQPVLLVALAAVYFDTAKLSTQWSWSACRLAPTIGLFHGYPLYSAAEQGPINGWLYGPVGALVWTPAALANSPRPALFIASAINLVFLLGPLLVAGRRAGILAFAFSAAALLQIYATWYMASALNVDAIAVGLGAGSCLALLGDGPPVGKQLMLGALLGVLAAWTKQTEGPLLLAQVCWLWFRHGRGIALRYTGYYAGAFLVLAALIFCAMEPRDVILNMWTIPSAHALPGGWAAGRVEITDFCRYTVIFWLPCLVVLLVSRKNGPENSAQNIIQRHPFLLYVAAALVLLPLGVMATIKVGGDRNSMHSVYYLAVAATLALAQIWSPLVSPQRAWLWRGLVLLAAVIAPLLAVRQVAGYPRQQMLPQKCLSQEAWSFARQHPGRVYFPWDPLATLMAEGRLYHFEYGVMDRLSAGITPSPGQISRDLPVHLDTVVYPKADYARTMLQHYLPEYIFAVATDDWLIYRKDGRK